jgi:multiple sugar transport system substrate-binding protein
MFRRAGVWAGVMLSLLAGGGAAESRKPLVVWAMGEEGKKIAVMARRFEDLNPGAKVETQAIPWEAAHAKLLTAVVGGIPPDVSQLGTTWMAEFAAMGALENLDRPSRGIPTANPDAFFPGSLHTCEVDGVLYGVPWYVDTRVLFYRKDLLASVGYPDPPATWEDLERRRAQVGRSEITGWQERLYGISLGSRGWTELMTAVWQNGGDPLKPSEPGLPGSDDAYYRSFFQEKLAPAKEGADVDLYHAFRTGYLPMFISGPWMVELVKKELARTRWKMGGGGSSREKNPHVFCGGMQPGGV